MEPLFYILGFALAVIGFAGSVLPVLPGPLIAWAGLLCFDLTKAGDLATNTLVWTGIAAVLVMLLDQLLTILGAKGSGGSNAGVWGAGLGLIPGLFLGLPGIILGPIIGAFIGEYLVQNNEEKAFRAAMGSFLGFLAGTGVKLVYVGGVLWWGVRAVIYALFA